MATDNITMYYKFLNDLITTSGEDIIKDINLDTFTVKDFKLLLKAKDLKIKTDALVSLISNKEIQTALTDSDEKLFTKTSKEMSVNFTNLPVVTSELGRCIIFYTLAIASNSELNTDNPINEFRYPIRKKLTNSFIQKYRNESKCTVVRHFPEIKRDILDKWSSEISSTNNDKLTVINSLYTVWKGEADSKKEDISLEKKTVKEIDIAEIAEPSASVEKSETSSLSSIAETILTSIENINTFKNNKLCIEITDHCQSMQKLLEGELSHLFNDSFKEKVKKINKYEMCIFIHTFHILKDDIELHSNKIRKHIKLEKNDTEELYDIIINNFTLDTTDALQIYLAVGLSDDAVNKTVYDMINLIDPYYQPIDSMEKFLKDMNDENINTCIEMIESQSKLCHCSFVTALTTLQYMYYPILRTIDKRKKAI